MKSEGVDNLLEAKTMDFDLNTLTSDELYAELEEIQEDAFWLNWIDDEVMWSRVIDILEVLKYRGIDPEAPEYIERWIKAYL